MRLAENKYGLSWQIVPARPVNPKGFLEAILQMKKNDIETLRRAQGGT
jgi:predicted 3-demethylubiquinone-9 3-methyltransferase (glyoxalase superfamily)